MSRHAVPLPGGRALVVGWDPALQTYFAVIRAWHDEETDEPELWVGTDLHELYDLDDLARAVAPYASHLTPELALQLERDREENRA